jgi:hypothetical protein
MPHYDRGRSFCRSAGMVSLSWCQQCTCAFGTCHLVRHVEGGSELERFVVGELLAFALTAGTSGEDAGCCRRRFALDIGRGWAFGGLEILIVAIVVNWEAGAQRREGEMLKVGKRPPRAARGRDVHCSRQQNNFDGNERLRRA